MLASITLPGPHGLSCALVAALLFGASTPLAKVLLGTMDPLLLAGLLYLGSGSGLLLWRWLRWWWSKHASRDAGLKRGDLLWLTGATVTGGVIALVSLMIGLATTPVSAASLLLNLEGVFTTILAWCVFKEHYDRRLVWGMAAIATGGLVLSWGGRPELRSSVGTIAVVGAWLHLTERHEHTHWHEPLDHEHGHIHDAHHPHGDEEEPHNHLHTHPVLHHSHPHYPDIHHQHGH